jgi:hypothetical protein
MRINDDAVEFAKQLVFDGDWALNTVWSSVQPTAAKAEQYRAQVGDRAFARWYLVIDDDGSLAFAVGDFRSVHHSAIKAARRYGELNGVPELVSAADEILELFDRANAC